MFSKDCGFTMSCSHAVVVVTVCTGTPLQTCFSATGMCHGTRQVICNTIVENETESYPISFFAAKV